MYLILLNEMVYSAYVKQRILFYSQKGKSSNEIMNALAKEGLQVSKSGIHICFLGRVIETGTIACKPGSGCPIKATAEI